MGYSCHRQWFWLKWLHHNASSLTDLQDVWISCFMISYWLDTFTVSLKVAKDILPLIWDDNQCTPPLLLIVTQREPSQFSTCISPPSELMQALLNPLKTSFCLSKISCPLYGYTDQLLYCLCTWTWVLELWVAKSITFHCQFYNRNCMTWRDVTGQVIPFITILFTPLQFLPSPHSGFSRL